MASGTRPSRRGEGWQVPECDFRPTVNSESSDTLYEATNREKLKQETAWQIPESEQGIRKTSSPVMAMLFGITR